MKMEKQCMLFLWDFMYSFFLFWEVTLYIYTLTALNSNMLLIIPFK